MTRRLVALCLVALLACGDAEPTFTWPSFYTLDTSVPEGLKASVRQAYEDWCIRTDGRACAMELEYPGTEAHEVPVLVTVTPSAETPIPGSWAAYDRTYDRFYITPELLEVASGPLLLHTLRHEVAHACYAPHLPQETPGTVLLGAGLAEVPLVDTPETPQGIDAQTLQVFLTGCRLDRR